MEFDKIIEILSFTLPAVITGFVAYYFFLTHTKNEERKLQLSLLKENQKESLPIKLQAYERMTLYLERINPNNLIVRIQSINNDKHAYAIALINTIEQEFEHNIAQQIYVSNECWGVIIASKNTLIHLIKKLDNNGKICDANGFKEAIIKSIIENGSPTSTALSYVKNEVKDII